MGRINANSTLRVEDYAAEYRKTLLPRLFQTLNLLFTQILSAVNGNIEFGPNIPAQDNVVEFNFAGVIPTFKWNLNRPPKMVLVGRALEDGFPVIVATAFSYDSSNGLISLTTLVKLAPTGVSALRTGSNYKISIRTLA